MKRETSELWKDMALDRRSEAPDHAPVLEQMGWNVWPMTRDAWEKELAKKLRLVRFERTREKPAYKNERKPMTRATTFSVEAAGSYRRFCAGQSRWDIENPGFNPYPQYYHLTHNYHHEPKAILASVALMSVSYGVKLAYFEFAVSYTKSQVPRVELREALVDRFVTERSLPVSGTVPTCNQPPP